MSATVTLSAVQTVHRRLPFFITLIAILLPVPAEAHLGGLKAGDFWLGFLHPLTTLEDALAFVALGILAGQAGEERGIQAIGAFCLLLAAGALAAHYGVTGPWVGWINLGSLFVLGGLVALQLQLPLPVPIGLAMICGLTHGLSNGVEIVPPVKPWLFVPGFALAGFVSTYYVMFAVVRMNPWWMRIALRVIGSWIAAVGLLIMALQSLPRVAS